MRKKLLSFLSAVLMLMVGSLSGWAGVVNIPTVFGNYITTSESATTGTINNNDGGNLGGIYNGSSATFTLNNPVVKDMVLAFKMGRNDTGGDPKVKVTLNNGSSDVFTTTVGFINTGSWTPSDFQEFRLGSVAAGTYTLKFEFSTSSGYVGNLGSIGLYDESTYNLIPGNINLDYGKYVTAKVESGGNVGYVSNGATASYTVNNIVAGTATLNIGLAKYGDGTLTVDVFDIATGNKELTKVIDITSDVCKGLETPSAFELGELSTGLKTIILTAATSGSFLCNYKNVSVSAVPNDPAAWRDINIDLTKYPLGQNAGAKYLTFSGEEYIYSNEEPAYYNAHLSSTGWNGTQHGYNNITMTVPVKAGIYKVTFGGCNFGSENGGYLTDADDNTLTVINANGKNITAIDNKVGCSNSVSVWYEATEDMTIKAIMNNYIPSIAIEKVYTIPENKNIVTYSLGVGVLGQAPATVSINTDSYTLPTKNYTVYKEGYTLIGWNDGTADHALGETFTVENDITLTPVFRQNTKTLDDRTGAVVLTWDAQKKNGCPEYNYSGNSQDLYFVTQTTIGGETIDVAEKVTTASNNGCFRNGSWTDWCQVNGTASFVLPSCKDAIVKFESYSVSVNSTIDGVALTGNASKTPSATVTDEDATVTVEYAADASYFRYMQVTLPKPGNAWDNFEDIAIDFTNGAYITSEEKDVITIGVKKDGANVVRTTSNDANAIATVAGKYHSNEHGVQNFSMTIGVPGNVRITAGTCNWGGNLTVKKGGVTVATVNTNNGTCYHGNPANNKVITYYEGEATTLTIEGGNYMPFISVESVNNVPALYTLTFKNGDTTVDTKQIYQGTGVGTLPTICGLASDQYFLGWYSNASQVDTRINTATIPTGDTTYYAVIKTINTTNGMLVPEAGDAFSFIAHLEKANATATAQAPAKIFLQNGTYDLGTIINTEVRNNVHIIGESRGGVTVVNHPAQAGMSSSETLNVRGSNVYMQNFTVRCDVSYPGSAASGVGTAIRTYGDRNIFYNMDMQGNQDTFNTPMGDDAVAYVKGGRIEGTVDYICGSGNIWFEGVNLYMNDRSNADVIAAPSTAASTQYGYVFNGCTIDGAAGQADKYNLARPWHNPEVSNVPAATWINTNCIIKPSAKGYTTMGSGRVRFHEFNTMDAEGTVITGHNFDGLNYAAGSDEIYLGSIGNYTYANVLGGWDPEAVIASYNEVTPTINAQGYGTFSCAYPVQIAGVKAYKATINAQGDALECTEIENGLVPAGEGVLLYGEVGASVKATYVASAPAVNDNDLKATTLANGSLKDINEVGEKVLVLSGNTFVPYATGNPFVANKAYLTVAASAKPFRIVFNNQTAGISTVSAAKKVANAKFIENGRIVIVKDGAKYNVAGQVIK